VREFIWHKTTDYFSLKPIAQVRGVCFDNEGSILIIRHSNGNWDIPGGKPENNETPEQTLKRELDEEADVSIGKNIMIGYYEVISDKSTIYQLRFAALLDKKKPRTIDPDSGTVKERKFVPPDEFFNYVKIEGYRLMIDEAISWFEKNREL